MKKNRPEEQPAWSSTKKFALTWTVFTLVAMPIGALSHAKWFATQYESFNFITASEIVIPLALASMLLLGLFPLIFSAVFTNPKAEILEQSKPPSLWY
jgi:hypothetical protein